MTPSNAPRSWAAPSLRLRARIVSFVAAALAAGCGAAAPAQAPSEPPPEPTFRRVVVTAGRAFVVLDPIPDAEPSGERFEYEGSESGPGLRLAPLAGAPSGAAWTLLQSRRACVARSGRPFALGLEGTPEDENPVFRAVEVEGCDVGEPGEGGELMAVEGDLAGQWVAAEGASGETWLAALRAESDGCPAPFGAIDVGGARYILGSASCGGVSFVAAFAEGHARVVYWQNLLGDNPCDCEDYDDEPGGDSADT